MFVKLTEEYKPALIKFIKKHHQPEKGIFIDYNLIEGRVKHPPLNDCGRLKRGLVAKP